MTEKQLRKAAEIVRSSAGARRTLEKVQRGLAREHPDALIYTELADGLRGEAEELDALAHELDKAAMAAREEGNG